MKREGEQGGNQAAIGEGIKKGSQVDVVKEPKKSYLVLSASLILVVVLENLIQNLHSNCMLKLHIKFMVKENHSNVIIVIIHALEKAS